MNIFAGGTHHRPTTGTGRGQRWTVPLPRLVFGLLGVVVVGWGKVFSVCLSAHSLLARKQTSKSSKIVETSGERESFGVPRGCTSTHAESSAEIIIGASQSSLRQTSALPLPTLQPSSSKSKSEFDQAKVHACATTAVLSVRAPSLSHLFFESFV